MSNAISSLIFMFRNVDKTKNGEIGRAPVAALQSLKVIQGVSKYDSTIAKGAEEAVSLFTKAAKHSKAADIVLKSAKWGLENNMVNPLICVSSGIKVLNSEDKTSTAVKELAAISGMLAGESVAKKVLAKIFKSGSMAAKIASGVLFVCASIASYSVGEYVGKDLAKTVKANTTLMPVPAKINQTA